jgi:hypothetical protein
MSDWNVLYKELTVQHDYIKPNPPATQKQILDVEKLLGNKLPVDLKELLFEMNGDSWLIFSTEQIIETNLSARKLDCYMPLDCLLFFGGSYLLVSIALMACRDTPTFSPNCAWVNPYCSRNSLTLFFKCQPPSCKVNLT